MYIDSLVLNLRSAISVFITFVEVVFLLKFIKMGIFFQGRFLKGEKGDFIFFIFRSCNILKRGADPGKRCTSCTGALLVLTSEAHILY